MNGALRGAAGTISETGLVLLAAGAPLAIGAVHLPTIIVAAFAACLSLVALAVRRGSLTALRIPLYGWLLIGVTAYTAFQAVPLPSGFLQLVAPATVEVLEVSLRRFGGMPPWHAISLAPAETLVEALKVGSCSIAFVVAHNLLRRSGRQFRVLTILVVVGVVVTLLGFIGVILAPGRPLLLYSPRAISGAGGLIATSFVNPNHGAAFLTLCTLLAAGLAASVRDVQARLLLGLASVLLGAGACLTLSRGGMLGLSVGFAAFTALVWSRRRLDRDKPRRFVGVVVPAVGAAIATLAAWLAYEPIINKFLPKEGVELGKIELWASGARMVLENPWVGVGRGAFLTTFPRYLSSDLPNRTYSHLENQYLHLPAELGIPIAALLFLGSALALVVWAWRRRGGSALSAAMIGALMALAVHNTFDFNLELLGVALPAAVLAGALSLNPQRKRTRHRSSRAANLGAFSLAGCLGLTATLATYSIAFPPSRPDDQLNGIFKLIAAHAKTRTVLARVREAVERHPGDALPHLAVARLLLARGDRRGLSWLNQAMFLHPNNPELHLEAALALARLGRRRQALLEYRAAFQRGAKIGALKQALSATRSIAEVTLTVPNQAILRARAVVLLISAKRNAQALRLARITQRRWSRSPEVAAAEVSALLASGLTKEAYDAAKRLVGWAPTPQNFMLWARAARRKGVEHEIRVLKRACAHLPGDLSLAFAQAGVYLRSKQLPKALAVAEQMLTRPHRTRDLVRVHELLSRIHRAAGRHHRAQFEAERARVLRRGM